jgi:GGDEF domain-containing protein
MRMKLLGVRADPLSAVRRRAALVAEAAQMPGAVQAPDSASFLGITETELTPAVRAALTRLISEIDELRLSEAEDLADLDALTPLLNRRAFLRELKRVLTFAQRYGGPASLIYFDLDGFKAVNDRFGHAAGDEALKGVAQRLAGQMREGDIIGRIGGDEFGVILETEPVPCGEWLTPVKISYGVRQIDPTLSAEQVLADADQAMYGRKRAG